MRKFILPVLLCFIFINPATANDEIKSLLKTLDKALKYKLDYAEQKQEQIDSLKIELKLHQNTQKSTNSRIIMFRLFFLSKRFRFNLCYSYE